MKFEDNYEFNISKEVSECWIWTGCRNKDGYGRLKFMGRKWLAHRLCWETNIGHIPDGMKVLHKCDNPACVNPGHLFLGTNKDNAIDCLKKGRSKAPKVTELQVIEIRKLAHQGMSYRNLAKLFPIKKSAIGDLVRKNHWIHIQ